MHGLEKHLKKQENIEKREIISLNAKD